MGDFPYSVIQNPYQMAKFHIYVELALFHPPNTQFFFTYYFLMVVVDQFQKKLEIPPPKTRRENAFLKNGFKNLFPFILQEH